ncbi:hypothetical protein G9A89_003176 [Geosiphon pyriformis]|nr:hypothetical protein G9A89_003176 [Geosiphon pyriformis]
MKVKGHSGILGNVEVNAAAGHATCSNLSLSVGIHEHFLVAEDTVVSDNTHYFVRNIFWSVDHAWWKAGPGQVVILKKLIGHVNWDATAQASASWLSLVDECDLLLSIVLCTLGQCSSDVGLYLALCKGFVLMDWCVEAIVVFEKSKEAVSIVVKFVQELVESHRSKIWLVRSKHRADMERAGLVGDGGMVSGVVESFVVGFGHRRLCFFFSGLNSNLHVMLGV